MLLGERRGDNDEWSSVKASMTQRRLCFDYNRLQMKSVFGIDSQDMRGRKIGN